jgi:hypothetical protein
MMTFSPVVMNGGTRVFRPVSQVASFSWLVAVAPLMPGGVSVIAPQDDDLGVRKDIERHVAHDRLGQLDLLVALEVHEDGHVALLVEELHLPTIEVDLLDILARAETLVDERSRLEVAQLHLDEGAQIAWGPMLDLGDQKQLSIHLEGHAGAEIGAIHWSSSVVRGGVGAGRRTFAGEAEPEPSRPS